MQTQLPAEFLATPQGHVADRILRNCVHCGFCNATCPTYQLLGDELDGPRGRIYLMKQMFETGTATERTRLHLDRCLTCRNCETTCPSGVEYGHLVDIGREWIDQRAPRPAGEQLRRAGLRYALVNPMLFGSALRLGRALRGLLPEGLRRRIPEARPAPERPAPRHARRMLILEGCVQPDIDPGINATAAHVLDRLGISLSTAPKAGCCGALDQHLGAVEAARAAMRRNIDAWWPDIEAGAEAIVMTASGCGSQVKDYGWLLRDDPAYADKAARVSALARDLAEVLAGEDISALKTAPGRRIAFHPPCSLQHGQKVRGVIEGILTRLGHELVAVDEAHLCCGSAGTYSILQPEIAGQLRERKLSNLQARGPELITTANIGCQTHLAATSGVPVVHWITLLEERS
jgi:glycolate oxidase iron-sulfur subunit